MEQSPSPPAYDIAELARLASVSSRTIRYYEELGLVRSSGRGPGGRRRYGPDALQRLLFISRLKKLGLTLDEIRTLDRSFNRGNTPAMLDDLEAMLEHHLGTLETRLRELGELRSELSSYLERIRVKKRQADTT